MAANKLQLTVLLSALDRVTGLHVADRPREDVGPGPRALPGEGRGDAAAFLSAFRAAGWDGTLDVMRTMASVGSRSFGSALKKTSS